MRNRYLEKWEAKVKVRIVGSNINSYLKRVIKKKINIIKVIPVSKREVHAILKYSEYKKLLSIKSIYEIELISNLGSRRIEDKLKKNSILLLFMILGFFAIILLSKITFSIDIVHQDKNIRELLERELKRYGIKRYALIKDYDELVSIKNKILEDNKESLEWLEISLYGTKYIVRLEERKLNDKEEEYRYQSIVSKKDAVIYRIDAIRGEKVKEVNDYVSKGDTVIFGYITKPDNSRIPTKAEGKVYGEIWYEVDVDYPIIYQETNYTGKKRNIYSLYIFNKRCSLFDNDKYRTFKTRSRVLVSHNMLDIKFVKEKQYEVIIKDEVYTEDIARVKAIDYIKNKMINDNRDIIEIKEVKILNESFDEDSIEFKLFIRVIEDIGEVVYIESDPLVEKSE